MDIIKCKNCNNEFTGNYCNNCSQASNVDRINLKFIVSEIQKTFIHFDSGFLYTTKKLFVNPGKTILSYLNGARIHHFRSFSFLFFIAGAYLILINSSHLSMIKESVNGLSENELNKFTIDYFIQVQFFFIIAYSLFSLVLFHYRHLNFYEFIIMHTYLAGQRILISILLLPLKIWPATAIYDSTINSFTLVLGYALMIWAYVKIFSHKNSFLVIIKTMLLQIIIIGVLLFIIKSVFIK